MKVIRLVGLFGLLIPVFGHAVVFTLNTTSGGYTYKATAAFSYSSSILTVVLTNTQSSNAASGPGQAGNGQALTGLFWNMNTGPTATGLNAFLSDSSDYYVNGNGGVYTPGVQDSVAKNWAWKSGTPNAGWGTNFGIGAAGFGFFESGSQSPNRFDPTGTNVINGPNYGLLGGNWVIGGNQIPFLVNSATFTFNVGTGFNINLLNNVRFQYGSDLSEFSGGGDNDGFGDPVPEPTSMAMSAVKDACIRVTAQPGDLALGQLARCCQCLFNHFTIVDLSGQVFPNLAVAHRAYRRHRGLEITARIKFLNLR